MASRSLQYELCVRCARTARGELKERFGVLVQSRIVELPQEELQLIDETARLVAVEPVLLGTRPPSGAAL